MILNREIQSHVDERNHPGSKLEKNRLEENQEDDYCGNLEETRRWPGTLC